MDKFKDECGVFGIFGHKEASNLTYLGLYALQHRGQESAGIAASDGGLIRHHKAMGYVNEAFNSESLAKLPGSLAVGHVRYSTAGESLVANAHPIVVDSVHGQLAVCHNGNLVNAGALRDAPGRHSRIASSSTCIFHGPIVMCSARASTKCGRSSDARSRAKRPSMPT